MINRGLVSNNNGELHVMLNDSANVNFHPVGRSGMVLQHLGEGRYLLTADAIKIEGYYETIRIFFEDRFGTTDELEIACQNMDKEGNDRAYFGIFGVWLFGDRTEDSECRAV